MGSQVYDGPTEENGVLDDGNKDNSSGHANNFSMSSSRRRKYMTIGKFPGSVSKDGENMVESKSGSLSRDTTNTKRLSSKPNQKSLSLEKSKNLWPLSKILEYNSTHRNIYTPKGTGESLGKFIQESKKETFFSTKRGVLFPTLKSPTAQKRLF